jgi:FHA domain
MTTTKDPDMTQNNEPDAADDANYTTAEHRLPDVQPDPAAAPVPREAPPASGTCPGTGVLVVIRGPQVGTRYPLTHLVTVAGRHPRSTVFLDDITVSRRHAEFRWLDDEYWIVDVGSLNGTYVNRVGVQAQPLNSGDEIQIGKFRLVFSCQPQSEHLRY